MKIIKFLLIQGILLLFLGIIFSLGWISHYWMTKHILENNIVTHCESKPNRTAWLAKKDGVYRCFQEYNQWPKRAYGYNIPYEPENHYPTPLHFIQEQLRQDLQKE